MPRISLNKWHSKVALVLLDGSFIESMYALFWDHLLWKVLLTSLINSARLKKSSELKWILWITSFQSFIDLIFIELEPSICVFAFGILSKYCCKPLVLWLCCSLRDWKSWSNTSGRLLVNLSKTKRQLFDIILFFNLFILSFWYRGSDGSIDCLKLIILKDLYECVLYSLNDKCLSRMTSKYCI